MVWDIVRDSTFGVLVRAATGGKYFPYPEEVEGFEYARTYGEGARMREKSTDSPTDGSNGMMQGQNDGQTNDIERDDESSLNKRHGDSANAGDSSDIEKAAMDEEQPNDLARAQSQPIVPVKTSDGTVLVDWYTTDDPGNPMNWSMGKKIFVAGQIDFYTFAVYMASSIYTSAQPEVMEIFGVGYTKSALGLAMYVLGYGTGPLIWSPLSEIAIFGRNGAYLPTFLIYIILCVPTALVNNFAGLLVLRYLTGFFGSPCLANGAASMQDIFHPFHIPYALSLWSAAAFCGPALGPLLSGFSVTAEGWRWALWEILWLSGPVFIMWFFFLPETSPDSILLYRARRLRKLTNNATLQSESEIKIRHLTASQVAFDALIKPFEIMFLDPAVLFTNIYTALIYGIYYSFFEAFPIVYFGIYGFNLGETGVAFTSVLIGALIAGIMFCCLMYFVVIPQMKEKGMGEQEDVLMPSLIVIFGPPIGLFLFGWTARASIHWIVSLIGIAIYAASVFIISLGIFTYIPLSYPPYAASLFAGNDLCRSLLAFGAILFGRPLYLNLGIGKGSSLLAGLSFLGVFGVYLLFFYGKKLRQRSRFAVK